MEAGQFLEVGHFVEQFLKVGRFIEVGQFLWQFIEVGQFLWQFVGFRLVNQLKLGKFGLWRLSRPLPRPR